MKIELSNNEIDLLRASLSTRRRRAMQRMQNDTKKNKLQYLQIHQNKIADIDNLYSKLEGKRE